MTPFPTILDPSASLQTALRVMHRYDIRHVPVLDQGKLVGLLYERDVAAVLGMKSFNADNEPVRHLMQTQVLQVSPDAETSSVITELMKKKQDCVVVVKGEKMVGIFTDFDAIQVLLQPHY